MKSLFTLATLGAIALALPTTGFAAPKKETPTAPVELKKTAEKPITAAEDKVKAARALPMYARVDSMDASAKTFTMTRKKDGVSLKHVVTGATEIKNGEAAAKFEDIKVGDWVNGSRNKKSETEYEVVKITKFGPAAPKAAGDAPKKKMKKEAGKE